MGLWFYITPSWEKKDHKAVGVAVVVAMLLTIGLRPVIVKIRRRGNRPRSGTLEILSDPDNAKFQCVH
jgi:flagellar biosynthesis/type III secretory pathway M-ring protein FliF/YscJ